MKVRHFSPRKLDVGAFIEAGAELAGDTPVAELSRLAEGLAPEADLAAQPPVRWHASGRSVAQRVGPPQLWLTLSAHADLPWTCQRCLHPVVESVSFERDIRFVAHEAEAVQLDAELDEDVLVLSRSFDLLELIEDELIMEAPLVPRHVHCPIEPRMSVADPEVAAEDAAAAGDPDTAEAAEPGEGARRNPFAVLAQLKKKPGDN